MKKILMLLLLAAGSVSALPYPQQDVAAVVTSEGFNLDRVLKIIDAIAKPAGVYPPRFDSEADKKRASQDVLALTNLLNLAVKEKMVQAGSPDYFHVLLAQAHLGWFGHNLQLPQAGAAADVAYQAAIKAAPANLVPEVKEEYGRFLTATGHVAAAEKYLRDAYAADKNMAKALGLNLLAQGKMKEAESLLENYSKAHPRDQAIKDVVQALKKGEIEVQK